ncbi:MAG: sulfite exporter TauE/SafE family protein [Thermodesulfobacteriota bacterium]
MSPLILLAYALTGGIAGLLAGLLGIGGGLVIVPLLLLLFSWQGMESEYVMHLALGTSLATIVFTAAASAYAHHHHGAVRWPLVAKISPGIICGTLAGSWLAARLATGPLQLFFAAFLFLVALQLLLEIRPVVTRSLPGPGGMFGAGGVVGLISSLAGIGGGSMTVPFLLWSKIPIHQAIGTAAAIGLPLGLAGTGGYVINGWQLAGLPPLAVGFVYLPAMLVISAATVVTAPLGASLAHSLSGPGMRRIFAVLLIIVATKMVLTR